MPDTAHLAAFAAAAITIALIPGPGLLYVLARSLGGGRGVGLRSSYGNGVGGMLHVAAAAAGLSALIAASATAFTIVKYAGAAYLVWLGVRTLRSINRKPPMTELQSGGEAPAGAFRQGVITEALNPKTALFFLTFLPQFCQPENGPVVLQVLVLGSVSVALNTLVDVAVALGAGRLGQQLRSRPHVWRRQQVATGGLLVGLGLFAAASGHRSK